MNSPSSQLLFNAALLHTIEEAGVAVLTLTEGLEQAELLASRLTRQEVERQLQLLLQSASALLPERRAAMAEIDWAGLMLTWQQLKQSAGPVRDTALWFAVEALVPATLMWLRVYRQQAPQWFKISPA